MAIRVGLPRHTTRSTTRGLTEAARRHHTRKTTTLRDRAFRLERPFTVDRLRLWRGHHPLPRHRLLTCLKPREESRSHRFSAAPQAKNSAASGRQAQAQAPTATCKPQQRPSPPLLFQRYANIHYGYFYTLFSALSYHSMYLPGKVTLTNLSYYSLFHHRCAACGWVVGVQKKTRRITKEHFLT